MKGRLLDLAVGLDGKQRITVAVEGDMRETYDALHESDISIEIKKYRVKRSLDANAYCWVLIDKLAPVRQMPKAEIYQTCIRSIGGVSEVVCVKDDAVERLIDGWHHNGLGWVTDTMPSKIPGCTNVVLYYGSSTYDTKQMASLIDAVVEACKSVDIDVATPDEIAKYKEEWMA